MTKEEALKKICAFEAELPELRRVIQENPEPAKPTAKQWLINFLNENAKEWRVEMGENRIVYYLDDQWIFDLDLKNNNFWCFYYKVWEIFYKEYSMQYEEVRQLIKDVVLRAFNCEGYTPTAAIYSAPGLGFEGFQL